MKLPRFNLRDLFWLVLVCALAVGWWTQERREHRLAAENVELKRKVELMAERDKYWPVEQQDKLRAEIDRFSGDTLILWTKGAWEQPIRIPRKAP